MSGNTLADARNLGAEMKLYTYLYVKEDVFALYGFSRLEEKTLFMRLIEISGVGPKLAMQVLGGYDLGTLTVAIATGDVKTLSKIKGLGKKTAELIVLNLREQVAVDMSDTTTPIGAGADADISDAIFALVSTSKTPAVSTNANTVAKHITSTSILTKLAPSRLRLSLDLIIPPH